MRSRVDHTSESADKWLDVKSPNLSTVMVHMVRELVSLYRHNNQSTWVHNEGDSASLDASSEGRILRIERELCLVTDLATSLQPLIAFARTSHIRDSMDNRDLHRAKLEGWLEGQYARPDDPGTSPMKEVESRAEADMEEMRRTIGHLVQINTDMLRWIEIAEEYIHKLRTSQN